MSKSNNNVLVGAVLFAAVAVSGSLFYLGYNLNQAQSADVLGAQIQQGIENYVQRQQEDAQAQNTPGLKKVEGDFENEDPVLGDKDAPVTIVEWSDFECPYCERFYSETHASLVENYVDKGLARIVFKNFPLSGHTNAYPMALMAECVFDQKGDEAFFKMHDLIFDNFGQNSPEDLLSYGVQAGADRADLEKCFESDKFKDDIYEDQEVAKDAGVRGTPGFLINGRLVSGAYPFEVFAQIIDEELANNK